MSRWSEHITAGELSSKGRICETMHVKARGRGSRRSTMGCEINSSYKSIETDDRKLFTYKIEN